MKLLQDALTQPRTVSLSLHESNFDAYGHVSAPVYTDLVQTAVIDALRAIDPESKPGKQHRFSVLSLAVRFRVPIPINTPSADVTLSLAAEQKSADSTTLEFKVTGRLPCAMGTMTISERPANIVDKPEEPRLTREGMPKIYAWDLPVLHNDRNPFCELSATRLLDNLFTARWFALKKIANETADDWIRRGFAFYLLDFDAEFLQPITQVDTYRYSTWVREVADDGRLLDIPFHVTDSATGQTLFTRGTLRFAIMDISNPARPRRVPMPPYGDGHYFHSGTAPAIWPQAQAN